MDSPWFGDYPSRSFLLLESLAVTLNPTAGNATKGPDNGTLLNSGEFPADLEDYFESEPYDAPLFVDYPPWLLHVAAACCILFILLGIPGNLITIIALFRCKKVRNATAVFIINLSVSDLMFCCFNLPLAASVFLHRAWVHGRLLCQMFPLLRYGLLAVSLFTVLAITINRYVMIGHPRLYPKLYGRRYLGLMVGCTWLFGFGALVATWLGRWGRFGLDRKIGSCSILPDREKHSPKEFLFIVAFVIPCLAIVVCYARIFYIVRQTALKSRANTHKLGPGAGPGAGRGGRGRFLRAEDSALGSTSVSTSATVTSTADNNNRAPAHPHLLCPPGAGPTLCPAEPSSSGVDTADPDDDNVSTRSGTPTFTSQPYSSKRRALSAVFRRGSGDARSPRRPSAAPHHLAVPGKMTPKDRKLLKMILVIFASFLVCYLPITISKTFPSELDLRGLNIAGYILIYLTTCINPIIYVVMSSEYRQAYKNLLMCRSGDSGQQRA